MKINFGMIVLNAAEFLEQSLDSVYKVANKIIIIEGAVNDSMTGKCLVAGKDHLSTDRTKEIIDNYHDPEEKIIYKRQGFASSKEDLCNMYLEYCDENMCDYIWHLDSDELYEEWALNDIKEYLSKNTDVVRLSFKPWHFYKNIDTVGNGPMFDEDIIRVFKYKKGARWSCHTPPVLVWKGNANPVRECGRVLNGEETKAKNWHLFHYSYLTHEQVRTKLMYHSFRGFYRPNWVNRIWEKMNDPDIVKEYGAHPFDETRLSPYDEKTSLTKFIRKHPRAITSHKIYNDKYGSKNPVNVLHLSDSWSAGGGCKSPYVLSKKMNELYGDTHEFVAFRCGVDPEFAGSCAYTINDDSKAILDYSSKKKFDIIQFEWWNQGLKKFEHIVENCGLPTLMNMHIYPIGGEWDLKRQDVIYDAVAVTSAPMLALPQFDGSKAKSNGLLRHINSSCDTDKYFKVKKNLHSGFNVVISTTLNKGKFRHNTFKIINDIVNSQIDIIVHFIGVTPDSGVYVDSIREAFIDNKRIHFVGYVDTAEYLTNMDAALVILPDNSYATSECFLQECMCVGLPTIKIGGFGSQVVTPDNIGGYIANDEKEFMEYFYDIYSDKKLRIKIKKDAREVIKSRYTTKHSAIKMRELYEDLLDA